MSSKGGRAGGGSSTGGKAGGGSTASTSSLHYTSAGTLDMRYNSSKEAVASGRQTITSSIKSTPTKSTTGALHYTSTGTLDMRYNSSKEAVAAGHPTVTSSTKTSTPSTPKKDEIDSSSGSKKNPYHMGRKTIPESEKPCKEDRDRSHIVSWEFLNKMNEKRQGRPLEEDGERYQRIEKGMNSADNLRYKTVKGNRGASGDEDSYWKSDRDSDKRIMESLENPDKLLTKFDAERVERAWERIARMDIDEVDKKFYREQVSKLKDTNGLGVVRTDASLDPNAYPKREVEE